MHTHSSARTHIRLLLIAVIAASVAVPVVGGTENDCRICSFCFLGGDPVPCCAHWQAAGASDCIAITDEGCTEFGGFCLRMD